MNEEPPKEKKASSDDNLVSPIIYWGALLLLFGVSKQIAETDEPLARYVFFAGLALWLLCPLFMAIIGKNLKETKDNFVGFMQLGAYALACLLVLVALSFIFPSSCTSDSGRSPADSYYRR